MSDEPHIYPDPAELSPPTFLGLGPLELWMVVAGFGLILWLLALLRKPVAATSERAWSQISLGDVLATTTSVGLAIGLFVLWQSWSESRTPWLIHTPANAMGAVTVFVFYFGILLSLFGRGPTALIPPAIALQILCVLTVVIAPFGFDHQSSWGLDFNDLIFVGVVYCAAVMGGLSSAAVTGRRKAALLQFAILAGSFVVVLLALKLRGEL